jgi:hypothetical protein
LTIAWRKMLSSLLVLPLAEATPVQVRADPQSFASAIIAYAPVPVT